MEEYPVEELMASVTVEGHLYSEDQTLCTKAASATKGQWTPEEDQLLVRLVQQHGLKSWSLIARTLVGRIGKQCRERWYNHLRPDIKKDTWTEEEEMALVAAHAELGNKWAEIAKRIPGRTENSIKNHWNATKRKQLARRRRCRKTDGAEHEAGTSSSVPPSSVLLDYMRSRKLVEGCSSDAGAGGDAAIPATAATSTATTSAASAGTGASEMGFILPEEDPWLSLGEDDLDLSYLLGFDCSGSAQLPPSRKSQRCHSLLLALVEGFPMRARK